MFPERALPTALAPNRDVGFMLHGLLGPAVFTLRAGHLQRRASTAGSGDVDNNHAKDFAGRIFLQPCKGDPYSLLANFGVGVSAASSG